LNHFPNRGAVLDDEQNNADPNRHFTSPFYGI
jgi:hypothetical protein